MDDAITLGGRVLFSFEGDPPNEGQIAPVAMYRGRQWLLVSRLESHATGEIVQATLVPMAPLRPGHVQGDLFRLSTAIPRTVFDDPIPESVRRALGVVDAPGLADIPQHGPVQ